MLDVDRQNRNRAATRSTPPGDDGHLSACGTLHEEIEALRILLEGPVTPRLAERIAAARGRWPGDLRLLLFEGAFLQKSGEIAKAESRFRQALAEHHGNPWPGVRLTELLLEQRRRDDAASVFKDGVWPAPLPEEVRAQLLSRLCAAFADLSHRRAFLASLLQGTAVDRLVLLKLAALSFREQKRSEAQRLFGAAKELGPLPIESRQLELELLLTSGHFDDAFAIAMALQESHPERSDFARRAIQAAHLAGRTAEMLALLRRALTRWPGDWMTAFRYNRCTLPLRADRELFEILSHHAAEGTREGRWLFQFAVACLRHGETQRATAILAQFSPTSPVSSMATPLRRALFAYPPATWENPRQIDNDPERDVQIVRVAGAAATVIVLAGVQGGLNYLPFSHTDGLLIRHRVNVIYLRDLSNRAFTAGIRGLGQHQDSTVAGLKSLAAELGVPAITIGASLGGVAAIRIAALMEAHAAISFAGPVQHAANGREDDMPWLGARGARGTLFAALTEADTNLLAMVRAAPRTLFCQCFGSGYAPDAAAADLLRPLANVVLHAVAGCSDHFVVEYMLANHEFAEVLERMMQMPSPAA
jgi:tetratricopeptide (TPR) repeat protein